MQKFILILFSLLWAHGAAGLTDDEIIDRIYEHVSQMEKKFPNTHIRRTMTVRELDPDSGKVRKTSISDQDVSTRIGEHPQIKILSCSIDGANAKPEACKRKQRDRKPPLRLFGPSGHDHYRFELARDLSLRSYRGTIADFPLGMKEMEMEFFFDNVDGRSVPSKTRMDMTLYLPLVLNSRVISESVTSESRIPTD